MGNFAAQLVEQIPRLRRFARSLTGEPSNADELVQDCLERAWSRSARFQRGTDLRAWLFKIMHNQFLNQLRSQQRRPAGEPLDDQQPAPGNDPEQQAEQTTELTRLARLLDQLPDEQRVVLSLVTVEGLSYEEVAATLDIPLGTVMSRLYRARERLRRLLAGETSGTLRRIK